jgi:hypothetical protein
MLVLKDKVPRIEFGVEREVRTMQREGFSGTSGDGRGAGNEQVR